MKVRALKPITYDRKRYLKGDVFDASPFFARPLTLLGKIVKEDDEDQVHEVTGTKQPEPKRRSRRDPDEADPPRRRYRRRDMQAEG